MSSDNIRIRNATKEETQPHKPRQDRKQLPYMYYVVFTERTSGPELSLQVRFIFASRLIRTARDILDLTAALRGSEHLRGYPEVFPVQLIEEELL